MSAATPPDSSRPARGMRVGSPTASSIANVVAVAAKSTGSRTRARPGRSTPARASARTPRAQRVAAVRSSRFQCSCRSAGRAPRPPGCRRPRTKRVVHLDAARLDVVGDLLGQRLLVRRHHRDLGRGERASPSTGRPARHHGDERVLLAQDVADLVLGRSVVARALALRDEAGVAITSQRASASSVAARAVCSFIDCSSSASPGDPHAARVEGELAPRARAGARGSPSPS